MCDLDPSKIIKNNHFGKKYDSISKKTSNNKIIVSNIIRPLLAEMTPIWIFSADRNFSSKSKFRKNIRTIFEKKNAQRMSENDELG